MVEDEDRELRRWFAAQRSADLEAAPPFRRVWAAAQAKRRPRPRARFAVAAVATALALLALVWLRPHARPAPEPGTSGSIAQWRSPTDFLLGTPGSELLSTVPAVGGGTFPGLSLPVPPPKPSSTPRGETS